MLWAVFHVFKWRLLSRMLLRLVFKASSMLSPLLIHRFTEFVESNEEETTTKEQYYYATMLAIGIILLQNLDYFGHNLFDFHMDNVRTIAEKALKVMIFSKQFKLAGTSKKNYTFAQVLNMVNTEAMKSYEAINMILELLMQPIELIYCAFFIYYYLGWSILSGLVLWGLRFLIMR